MLPVVDLLGRDEDYALAALVADAPELDGGLAVYTVRSCRVVLAVGGGGVGCRMEEDVEIERFEVRPEAVEVGVIDITSAYAGKTNVSAL